MPVYIIEHLEPRLWKWCIIEYKHISGIVGKNNLWFTNIKNGSKELEKYGKVIKESVAGLSLKKSCLFDPNARKTFNPKEAKHFNYFIFGGILGDNPPKKRTKQRLAKALIGIKTFNIGKKQMSTDNAVYAVNEICKGIPIKKMEFKDNIEIAVGENESIILPYRYRIVKGKPVISKELIEFLSKRKGF